MAHRGLVIVMLVTGVLLTTLLNTTTPSTIPPIGILAFFVLLYTLVLIGLTYFLLGASRGLALIGRRLSWRRSYALSLRRAYLYASVLAFAPVILLGMNSVGTTSLVDTGLVVLFELIACFYVWRRS